MTFNDFYDELGLIKDYPSLGRAFSENLRDPSRLASPFGHPFRTVSAC